MGGRRRSSSADSVHRQPFRFGSLKTHDRRSATNLSAFETCNTTQEVGPKPASGRLLPTSRHGGRDLAVGSGRGSLDAGAFPVTNPLIRNSAVSNLKMLRSEEALRLPATKQTIPGPQALRQERR
jgi:hypothetical protein